MKNKNKRELEKYWAEQAAKKTRAAKKQAPAQNAESKEVAAQQPKNATEK